jgi:hypothetical protein
MSFVHLVLNVFMVPLVFGMFLVFLCQSAFGDLSWPRVCASVVGVVRVVVLELSVVAVSFMEPSVSLTSSFLAL